MTATQTLLRSYPDIFAARGSSYGVAMRRYPAARAEEFAQIVAAARLQPGMRIGDVPAGGGYLAAHLPAGVACESHEPCASFTRHGAVTGCDDRPLLPLPWSDDTLDAVLSLAGVHHLDDKVPLFRECRRVVRPGGQLVLSDVAAGSATARFLDGFVGDHNSTGHDGTFLSDHTLDELQTAGWLIDTVREVPMLWRFANRTELADFTRHLFDIVHAPSDRTIIDAVRDGPGLVDLPGGGAGMAWSLMTVTCTRPALT